MKKTILLSLAVAFGLANEISISNVYARIAPNGVNGAVFMDIKNDLEADKKIISAHTDIAKTTEIHTHKMVDGMKMMTQIDEIILPQGETTSLKPGSYHIMLMGLNDGITEDSEFDLTLTFGSGKTITIDKIKLNNRAKRLFLEP